MNTVNAIKIFGAGGLKVTPAVPEKHIINFFWPNHHEISINWDENGNQLSFPLKQNFSFLFLGVKFESKGIKSPKA